MGKFSIRRESPRRPLITAVSLALVSSASALSLANFQLITSNAIPSPCIVAYNTQIIGCSTSDFTNGNQCSSLCINGLLEEASIVQAICGGLTVNGQSLLGLTLSGSILETLCSGSGASTTTVKVTVQPSTSSRSTLSTTQSQITTTTSSSTAYLTTTISDATTTTSSSSAIINVPSSTSSTTTISVATTITDASQTTSTSSTEVSSTSTAQEAGTTKGGGSPFDAVVQSRAPSLLIKQTTGVLLAVCIAAVLLA